MDEPLDLSIKYVAIKQLFGRYDYELPMPGRTSESKASVSLLYGDNGTGKTTILELIFHLLSSDYGQGHRTHVAKTPFRLFEIIFANGTRVSASRLGDSLTGDFKLTVTTSDGEVQCAMINTEPGTNTVTTELLNDEARFLLSEVIAHFELDVFYLNDSRHLDLRSDTIDDRLTERQRRQMLLPDNVDDHVSSLWANERRRRVSVLTEYIRRTERSLNLLAMHATSKGETNARQSFLDILQTIALAAAPEGGALDDQIAQLNAELSELAKTSEQLAEFRLVSVIDAPALSQTLMDANCRTRPFAIQVLRPFLDGQRQRLDALQETYQTIRRFVETTNTYLNDKYVTFDIFDGLTIRLPEGQLDPDLLSSGEKHILLIFLNVITPSERSQLFIIDEPELSLNVKWQRTLVDSLVNLCQSASSQFLLATHSIELLTNHIEQVVRVGPSGE